MDKKKWTPEEQRILDETAVYRGEGGAEWAERNAALILDQARAIGELTDKPSEIPWGAYHPGEWRRELERRRRSER